jgi:hypothetical protein
LISLYPSRSLQVSLFFFSESVERAVADSLSMP